MTLIDVKTCLCDGNDDGDDDSGMTIALNSPLGSSSDSFERLLDSKYYSFQDLDHKKDW